MKLSDLETQGGKIAVVLLLILYLSMMGFILVRHNDLQETGRVLISNAFTSLMTLLLTYLAKRNGN